MGRGFEGLSSLNGLLIISKLVCRVVSVSRAHIAFWSRGIRIGIRHIDWLMRKPMLIRLLEAKSTNTKVRVDV